MRKTQNIEKVSFLSFLFLLFSFLFSFLFFFLSDEDKSNPKENRKIHKTSKTSLSYCRSGESSKNSHLFAAARGRFTLATKFSRDSDAESTVTDICHIVTYTRHCTNRLGELAKFLLNIRMTRRRDHRHLTSNGPNGRVKLLRRLFWDSWRNALASEH